MDDFELDAFLENAVTELKVKQDTLRARYGMGEYVRWWFDQEKETIQFIDDTGRVGLEVEFIDIGSLSRKSWTWKWAWRNDSVLPKLRARAEGVERALRHHGARDLCARRAGGDRRKDGLGTCGDLRAAFVRCWMSPNRAPSSDDALYIFFADGSQNQLVGT